MTRKSLAWLLLAFLSIALIATLPIRFFVSNALINAEAVEGSIWRSTLRGASVGDLRLGDIALGLHWPGRVQFDNGKGLAGHFNPFSKGVAVELVNGRLEMAAVTPLAEWADLNDVALSFGKAGCVSTAGRIQLKLASAVGGVPLGQTLSGAVRCQGADLHVKLSSQTGLEAMEFRLHPDFAYDMAMTIKPTSADFVAGLKQAGFAETELGYRFDVRGSL